MSRTPASAHAAHPARARCTFVPPYLVRRLGREGDLLLDDALRGARGATAPRRTVRPGAGAAWVVHDAGNTTELPGTPVRTAGDPATGDAAVDEAAAGVAGALALLEEVYGRSSYDGAGATAVLTVHYGRDYANAFWDGTQLVFGDGDGEVFDRFTKPVDVLAHELAHALVEHTAGLVYEGQPGALNESVADVVAACVKQRLLGQTPDEADWLIGEGLFLPGVQARGLRDMRAPGTAYDDPRLGRDPQPAHLRDLVVTADDNGGVHLNSGIPNRAFHLAAVAVGGTTWDGAGRIWFDALTGPDVGPGTDFAGFAAATVAAAGPHADAVRDAWSQVGVEAGAPAPSPAPTSGGATGTEEVVVRRSGGFAGRVVSGRVALGSDDARAAEVRALVERVDLAAVPARPAGPDQFVYDLDLCGSCRTVAEPQLTPDLRRLVALVLESGAPGDVR